MRSAAGVELSHVLRATTSAVITVPNGLDAIALTPTKPRNHLEDSDGAALNAVVLTEPSAASPALVAGVVSGRARVWDAASGRALLR